MLVFTLFFVQAVSISLCYDLELEGAVHIGNDLMRRFNNEILPLELRALEPPQPKPPRRPAVQLMAAEPNDPVQRSDSKFKEHNELAVKNMITEINGILDKKYEIMVSPTENPVKSKEVRERESKEDGKYRFSLKQHLSKKGSLKLKMLAYFIKNHLNPYTNISTVLKYSTDGYLAAVNEYYDFISKKPIKYHIDKEFVVLDMIESANQILLNAAKKLLDDVIKETNAGKSEILMDMPMLMDKIKNTVLEDKKDDLSYVCKTLSVCRPFPGYSDHLADLLSELLQLNDNSFKNIIKNLNTAITAKRNFFKTIMRENVYNKISSKLSASLQNIAFVREIFSILRSVISQRYKVFKSDSLVVKVKTKAVRILLDIIDKAFDLYDDNVNYIEIENTISSYKEWSIGRRNDVELITKKFIYNAVELLNYLWGTATKEEVKVLTDVIFTGNTKNRGVYDYLFTKGSVLVRDEEIHEHADVE